MDDLTEQALELNHRMDILWNEYQNYYQEIDEALFISNVVKSEYPDCANELLFELHEQFKEHQELEF